MLRVDFHSIAAKTDRKIAILVTGVFELIGRRRKKEHKENVLAPIAQD